MKALFESKSVSKKDRIVLLADGLINGIYGINQILDYAAGAKDTVKADCIEALEHASKTHPELVTLQAYNFALDLLSEQNPRLKWESARLIANTVHLYPNHHKSTAMKLLKNAEHEGTVVRWSAALALHNLIVLKSSLNKNILAAIKSLIESEEKNSIKKIYMKAIKIANV